MFVFPWWIYLLFEWNFVSGYDLNHGDCLSLSTQRKLQKTSLLQTVPRKIAIKTSEWPCEFVYLLNWMIVDIDL